MAKRGAEKDLNQDNWDQEEEEEEVSNLLDRFWFVLTFIIAVFELRFIFWPQGWLQMTNCSRHGEWRANNFL